MKVKSPIKSSAIVPILDRERANIFTNMVSIIIEKVLEIAGILAFNRNYALENRNESHRCASGMGFCRIEHCKQSHPFGEARKEGKDQKWRAVMARSRLSNAYIRFNRILLHILG